MHKRLAISFIPLIILSFLFFLTLRPEYIAQIIAQAGNTTVVNIAEQPGAYTWAGTYGNIGSGTTNITLPGTETVIRNDLQLPRCWATEIYATTAINVDWEGLAPANTADIDNYMGLSPGHSTSAARAFNTTQTFVVHGTPYNLAALETNSVSNSFIQGILMQGSTPVFVTLPREDALGFDGSGANYQMMLPVQRGVQTSYNFFVDPSDDCNRPPELSGLSDVSGYANEEYSSTFYATDPDGSALYITMEPYYNFINLGFNYIDSESRYRGFINFTPKIAGRYHTNLVLTDGFDSVRQRLEFDIGYCGDLDNGGEPRCQSRYESCETCPQDCGPCRDGRDAGVIVHEQPVCTGNTTSIRVHQRGDCQALHGVGVCEAVRSAKVYIYRLEGIPRYLEYDLSTNLQGEITYRPSKHGDYVVVGDESLIGNATQWVLVDEISTDSSGGASFTVQQAGEYRLVAEKPGYYPIYDYLLAQDCPEKEVHETPTGMVPANETKEPEEEQPVPVKEEWRPESWMIVVINTAMLLGGLGIMALIHHNVLRSS